MKTCSTCEHWRPWDREGAVRETFRANMGNCSMVVMWWDASEWLDEEPYTREISPKYKDQRAFVQDASDYSASLYTRKDFGCVDHKEITT
jgi:hypothetical protein